MGDRNKIRRPVAATEFGAAVDALLPGTSCSRTATANGLRRRNTRGVSTGLVALGLSNPFPIRSTAQGSSPMDFLHILP